jgi:MFS family permease
VKFGKSKPFPFTVVYLMAHLLDAPLFAMYSLLAFILTKDLAATALQITVYVSVKPLTAIFSAYWNEALRSHSIEGNISLLILLSCMPALFFPFVSSPWFCIFGFAAFFMADRAAVSGWMELLKTRAPESVRGWTISKCSSLMFIAGAVVPLLVAPWMDRGLLSWRWLFFAFGGLSLLRLLVILPFVSNKTMPKRISPPTLIAPWRRAFSVLRQRPDFAYFQLIFMFGGIGLVVMQAVLPKFVSQILNLSYTELALAFALAKALGYVCSARLWSSAIKRVNIYLFCGVVTAFAALSLYLIPLSIYYIPILYVAFFLYGVMQGGSHLGWQLSGPIFSGKESSTSYTNVNVLAIGLRGCLAPSLGSLLGLQFGIVPTLLIGATICGIGSFIGVVGYRVWGVREALSKNL